LGKEISVKCLSVNKSHCENEIHKKSQWPVIAQFHQPVYFYFSNQSSGITL